MKRIVLDFGWIFDNQGTWGNIGQQPQYHDGLSPFLQKKLFPFIPELYRPDLLMQSFGPAVLQSLISQLPTNPRRPDSPELFIGLELYHQLGKEQFQQLFTKSTVYQFYQKMLKQGKLSRYKFWDRLETWHTALYGKQRENTAALFSHAHQDHAVGSSFIREDVPRGMSAITRALLLADFRNSSMYHIQDTAARKQREKGLEGNQYPISEYPFLQFSGDGKEIEIAQGIFVGSYKAEHSIPGCLAFTVRVQDGPKRIATIAYPGDYRNQSIFKTMQTGVGGPIDLLLVEGTNTPNSRKQSATYTEAKVAENFAQEIWRTNEAKKLIIVDIVKNNFERLCNLVQEGIAQGRTIVLSPKIAHQIQSLQLFLENSKELAELSLPNLAHPQIKIWKRPVRQHSPAHQMLFSRYSAVDQSELSAHPENYLLIRLGHERLELLEGIAAPAVLIRSVYDDYDATARTVTQEYNRLSANKGWKIHRKGFHATGHGPLLPATHRDAKSGILAGIKDAEPSSIAVIHTADRSAALATLNTYPSLRDKGIRNIRPIQNYGDPPHAEVLFPKR